jgi:hypothetical protein
VEVWFPGIGWVTSDPTPAAPQQRAWWQPFRNAADRVRREPLRSGLLVLSGVAVAVAASGLVRRRRFRRSGAGEPTIPRLDPALAKAFARLEARLQVEGRPRAASETVATLSRRLARDGEDPELMEALHLLQRALYALPPPSEAECLRAAAALDRRAALSPAAAG